MSGFCKKTKGYIKYTEVFGLTILLISILWKGYVSDWWDNAKFQTQYYIQEKANLTIISGIKDILRSETINDLDKKYFINNAIEKLEVGTLQLVSDRDERNKLMNTGQITNDSNIQLYLGVLGSILIIIGRFLELKNRK
ncbi:hypothetical protein [Providencia manganoxydans]|uniref:hypothetical protein n=1 Tax=Providencia manganoxydans TaxID=2923283 RepID=UPI0032DBE036